MSKKLLMNNIESGGETPSDPLKIVTYTFTGTNNVLPYQILPAELNYNIEDVINSDGSTTRTLSTTNNIFPTKLSFHAITNIIDISYFKLADGNVNLNNNFSDCTNLRSIDLSNIGNGIVTNIQSMCYNCSKLTSFTFPKVQTNIYSLQYTFSRCSKLEYLDISNIDTTKVTTFFNCFYECKSLTSLDLSSFVTTSCNNLFGIFNGCMELTDLNISSFNTEKVVNMSSMFSNCKALTSLDLSHFKTDLVTTMDNMFSNCTSLTDLNISSFNTEKVVNMSSMFSNCTSLTDLNISNFNTEKVTNMSNMFSNCGSLTNLDLSHFKTDLVTNMNNMFGGCDLLTSLDISNFNTEKVSNMANMFSCPSLTNLDLSHFNTKKVSNMANMFILYSVWAVGDYTLNLSGFNTCEVNNMNGMFTTSNLDLSSFSTNYDTQVNNMFVNVKAETTNVKITAPFFTKTEQECNFKGIFERVTVSNEVEKLVDLDFSTGSGTQHVLANIGKLGGELNIVFTQDGWTGSSFNFGDSKTTYFEDFPLDFTIYDEVTFEIDVIFKGANGTWKGLLGFLGSECMNYNSKDFHTNRDNDVRTYLGNALITVKMDYSTRKTFKIYVNRNHDYILQDIPYGENKARLNYIGKLPSPYCSEDIFNNIKSVCFMKGRGTSRTGCDGEVFNIRVYKGKNIF